MRRKPKPAKNLEKPVWSASHKSVAKVIGYMRVSTDAQSTDQQMDALRAAGCVAIYADEAWSGADRNRPGLSAALRELREGDTLVIVRFDRLARSVRHLLELAEDLRERGCSLRSLHDHVDTSSAAGKLLYTMLAAIAEFERSVAMERTRERLAAKKRRGESIGRPVKLTAADLEEARVMLAAGKSAAYVASRFRVSRATLYRHIATP